MPVTAFYASLLAILFLLLSVRVMTQRTEAKVEIGHGDSAELFRRARVHANFAEYVPLALLLIGFSESLKAPSLLLHILGLALLAGRVSHAYGLSHSPQIARARNLGMTITLLVIMLAAFICFVLGGFYLII